MYIRMIFIMLISLYTSRVVLEVLGVEDFGIYSLVGGIVSIFTVLSGSLNGTVQRFLNIGLGEGNHKKTESYFKQSLTIFVMLFFLFLIVGESVGLWLVENKLNIPSGRELATYWVYQFSLVAVLFAIIQIPFSGAVIARERMGFFALMGIIDVCSRLAIVIFLKNYASPDNLILYAALISVVQISITFAYIIYAKVKFAECVFGLQWDKSLVKEILSFITLSFWGNAVVTFTAQGVNVVLNLFGGAALNAATGIAQRVNTAVIRMVECINTPIKPQIVKSYAVKDYSQMIFLFERNSKYSLFLMVFLLFPLILECDIILSIWLKDVPDYAVTFTRLVLIESFFYVFSFAMATVVNATGKLVKMEVVGRMITLAVLPLSYFMLKRGAPMATPLIISASAQLLYVVYLFADVRSKTGIRTSQYFANVLKPVLILILALALACVPEVLFLKAGVPRFLAVGFTTLLVGGATLWFLCLDGSERQFVKGFLRSRHIPFK